MDKQLLEVLVRFAVALERGFAKQIDTTNAEADDSERLRMTNVRSSRLKAEGAPRIVCKALRSWVLNLQPSPREIEMMPIADVVRIAADSNWRRWGAVGKKRLTQEYLTWMRHRSDDPANLSHRKSSKRSPQP